MCSSQDWRRSRLLAMGLGWERFDWSALQILQQFICFDLTRCSTLWLACILSSGLQSIPVEGKYYLIHCGLATNLSYVCYQGATSWRRLPISWSSTQLSTLESLTVLHTECPSPCETICFRFLNLNNRVWAMIGLRMVGLFLFFIGIAFSASPSSQDKTQVFFVISIWCTCVVGSHCPVYIFCRNPPPLPSPQKNIFQVSKRETVTWGVKNILVYHWVSVFLSFFF